MNRCLKNRGWLQLNSVFNENNWFLLLWWRDQTRRWYQFQQQEPKDRKAQFQSYLKVIVSDQIPDQRRRSSNHLLYYERQLPMANSNVSICRVLGGAKPQTFPLTVVKHEELEFLLSFIFYSFEIIFNWLFVTSFQQ